MSCVLKLGGYHNKYPQSSATIYACVYKYIYIYDIYIYICVYRGFGVYLLGERILLHSPQMNISWDKNTSHRGFSRTDTGHWHVPGHVKEYEKKNDDGKT